MLMFKDISMTVGTYCELKWHSWGVRKRGFQTFWRDLGRSCGRRLKHENGRLGFHGSVGSTFRVSRLIVRAGFLQSASCIFIQSKLSICTVETGEASRVENLLLIWLFVWSTL